MIVIQTFEKPNETGAAFNLAQSLHSAEQT